MSDMERAELRQRTLAMTDEEIDVVVRALPIDALHSECIRRYKDKEIKLDKIIGALN